MSPTPWICAARLAAIAASGLFVSGAAPAATTETKYPSRPIRMVVPSTPGGVTDIPARAVAEVMRDALGQAVVLDNRPGAAGRVAAEIVARAPADGYTLFVPNGSAFSIAMAMVKNVPYDVVRDFESVSLLSELPGMLAVHPSLPAKTVTELVALAKASPGKLALATAGVGSGGHVVALRMGARSGVDFLHVAYKGEQQALIDAIAGNVPVVIGSAIKPYVDNGQLRAIASLGRTRAVHFPELPTMIEQGYPGVFQVSWNGVSAPARTPPELVTRLNRAINAALASPRVRKLLADNGFTVTGGDPATMASWVKSEIARYRQVVAEFKIPSN